jgi:tetrahydromethanopterin S-methyltransferase subunit A
MKKLEFPLQVLAGKICEYLIPIRLSYLKGNGEKVAICTLSDMGLMTDIVSHQDIMNKVYVVGRLLSENRGIDDIIWTVHNSPNLRYLILCGRDGTGHLPGQALTSLYKNGITDEGHIKGASGANPVLKSTMEQISNFMTRIEIFDLIGSRDISQIKQLTNELNQR